MNIKSLLNDTDTISDDGGGDDEEEETIITSSSSSSQHYLQDYDEESDANTIIRLLSCPLCKRFFMDPVTLPCGNTFCRSCLLQYTSLPNGRFNCPIVGCSRVHCKDARTDVTIQKLSDRCRKELVNYLPNDNNTTSNHNVSSSNNNNNINSYNSSNARSSNDNNNSYNSNNASSSNNNNNSYNNNNHNHHQYLNNNNSINNILNYNNNNNNINNNNNGNNNNIMTMMNNQNFNNMSSLISSRSLQLPPPPIPSASTANQTIRDMLIQDVECTVCFHLFLDPITTSCGHTFCKSCLTRSLDHSGSCPLCRHLFHNYVSVLNHPVNKSITTFIKSMYPSLFSDRIKLAESELSDTMRETPLFISILIFPRMPCFIHIFEAHYRLMLRRCLESRARQFGMVLRRGGNNDYYEYGTMLEIKSTEFLTDGRSLVETIGTYRFRILSRSKKDGYDVGDIERIDDVSPDEEAALERNAIQRAEINNQNPSNPRIYEPTTSELIATAHQFIESLRNGNAPWLLQRLNTTFGDMPDDPSDFSFWVASVIPIDESEKYKLLEKRSIRERLKMVVSWINQLKEQWWFARDCVIS